MKRILRDGREIKQINYNNIDDEFHAVGGMGCTKIEAYAEKGLHNDIAYLAVYYNDKLKYRVPAHTVEIVYDV